MEAEAYGSSFAVGLLAEETETRDEDRCSGCEAGKRPIGIATFSGLKVVDVVGGRGEGERGTKGTKGLGCDTGEQDSKDGIWY